MLRDRWIIGTALTLACITALAGCVPPSGQRPAVPGGLLATREPMQGAQETAELVEALRQDAEAYAQQFGVTLDEAVARLRYQDDIGDLNAALQTNEAGTFGGLWIQHEPDYRIVVLFTQEGQRTIGPYLAGRPYAHLVDVREARYTLVQLESLSAQATRELAKLDFGASVSLDVSENRVEVMVSDREWFEAELRRAGARLPQGVEVVVVEGGTTARDKDLLLTRPVPSIAFPRQKPVEGTRACMLAQLVGTLQLDGSCLSVQSLDGQRLLPIWPPEFTLRMDGDQVLVIDGRGQVAVRVGEEVYMGGGYGGVSDEWVLQQIPDDCRGEYFTVGCTVRPNLRQDSELFALDVVSGTLGTVLFLRYKPALHEQVVDSVSISGKLVAYDYNRCLHLQSDWGPGEVTLLWPADWSLRVDEGTIIVQDGAGQAVARMGEEVRLRARAVPHDVGVAAYAQLIEELPGDCVGASWLVDGVD